MEHFIDESADDLRKIEPFYPAEDFNAIVIIPTGKMHESGYECMKLILARKNRVVGVIDTGSDVIHLDGIGGYGAYDSGFNIRVTSGTTSIVGWSIDILPNGLTRIFSDKVLYTDEIICSDFIAYVRR